MMIVLSKRTLVVLFSGIIVLFFVGAAFARISQVRGRPNYQDIVWAVDTPEKVIALTFDDGPDPLYTPQVLEILRKNGVHCTFFTVGRQVEKYPRLSRSIIREGHEIANHTYSHPLLSGIKLDKLAVEIDQAGAAITRVTQQPPTLFRPPGGYYNEEIVRLAKERGYKVILWSWTQNTRDWANPGTESIISRVLNNAANGDIIILHDRGGDRSQTVQALQPIIAGLHAKGFQLITVSSLLEKGIKTNPVGGSRPLD